MQELYAKLASFNAKKIVWYARPSAYDWQWINYYHNLYRTTWDTNANLGGPHAKNQAFKAVCTSTMRDIYQAQFGLNRKAMEAKAKEWAGELAMTHNPLDDARYQAKLFHKLYEALAGNKAPGTVSIGQ
jgi:inhibitor of KinA sporulation pathway (predicted exonuclease)